MSTGGWTQPKWSPCSFTMNLLSAKGALVAVSAWKILWAMDILVRQAVNIPAELNECMSVVYGNVFLAYAIFYKAPKVMERMKIVSEELRKANEKADERGEAAKQFIKDHFKDKSDPKLAAKIDEFMGQEMEMMSIMEEQLHNVGYLNETLEIAEDLETKNADFLRVMMMPALIIIGILKNYKIAALTMHIANGFLQLHFKKMDDETVELFVGLTDCYITDILAPLMFLIPHWYLQKVYHFTQRVILPKIMRSKVYDPQMAFIDACVKGDKASMKTILHKYADKININGRTGIAGNTGLHIACKEGHFHIVQSILDCEKKNVKHNIENFHGFTPLALAASAGHKFIVMRLLKCKTLDLSYDQVEQMLRASTTQEFYQIAKMILTDFKRRSGTEFDPTLGTYINRIEECMRKKDAKSVDIYKKAIHAWFSLKNTSKLEFTRASKKSRKEIWQDFKDHFECSICYEEFSGGEIYSCENDHWICLACKKSWTISCPTCRASYGENGPLRRYKAEKILKDFSALREIVEEKPHNA